MSNVVSSFWTGLSRGGRFAVMGVAAICLALIIWGTFGLLRQEYGILFSDLAQGDAATITARLKKDKVPYRLSEGGSTISVPEEQVHDVRLALMAGDLPLSGGVGFEIFDKQGLGATEHSQKVSYQRALQGELARTIGTLDNVKHVRVHLVMPESTLFTRDRQEASAAVAVGMQPGATLQRQQIVGVQRLVAAAVPGLDPGRVVITDQRGVTLSAADTGGTGSADARLQVKRDVEEYVTHKIVRLLDSAFGPGQAIVSVDATLNFDASKTTIQDLLPVAGTGGVEGRVVRRRQATGSTSAEPIWTAAADSAPVARAPSSSMEVEYEYGRRIDEVIAAPGAVTRMSIGVIVPGEVTEEKRTKIAELVRMAAGIDEARGDAISVQPLSHLDAPAEPSPTGIGPEAEPTAVTAPATRSVLSRELSWPMGGMAAVTLIVVVLFVAILRRGRPRQLSPQDRQRLLDDIQRALADEGVLAKERAHP